ncbi:MAG: hypothetical protein OER95_15605, partial [Acidimicrobiia bacterium]|nr:hypothetical protein [Acidimicrobiia bacterium]
MAGAIDNPTETFLKYLNEGGQYPEGDGSWPSAGLEQADVELANLSDRRRIEMLLGRFAGLLDACRRADMAR